MNAYELLSDLLQRRVGVWAEAGRLRYRAPKGAMTDALLGELTQHKSEILALLEHEGGHVQGAYPLSYGQRALWFLHHVAPASAAYNIGVAVRIRSALDPSALRRALQALVDRHGSLRTTFAEQDGHPIQCVHVRRNVAFQELDASDWSLERLRVSVQRSYEQPFDLRRGPLLRIVLFTRSPEDQVLLLAVHHIVVDFLSVGVLVEELGRLYDAESGGLHAEALAQVAPSVALPPLRSEYQDFVRWQAAMLAGAGGERHWLYWQEKLGRELPVLTLPADRPRPPNKTFRGHTHSFSLDDALTRRLRSFSKAHGATAYVTLIGTFQVLLHRYTGHEDLVVGCVTAGRSVPEHHGIVGYFVNPVVLRSTIVRDASFAAFLDRTRDTLAEALDHQDFPFPLLVERMRPTRDPSRGPLVHVLFDLLAQPGAHLQAGQRIDRRTRLGSLDVEPFDLSQQEGQFDLTVIVTDADGSVSVALKYDSDLFDDETIARIAGHYRTLLAAVMEHPDRRVSDLPLMSDAELHRVLVAWNDTHTDYPRDRCIHELFERQVEQTPDAIAVVFEGQELTYFELNRRANRLAHSLRRLGVGPESVVALCLTRSIEMVTAVLAVLKAGGAYAPLDPASPSQRLALMVEDGRAQALLTQRALLDTLQGLPVRVLCVDAAVDGVSEDDDLNPVSRVAPNNLAYVMYTSGSTARPKGVSIEHRNVVRLVTHTNYVTLGPSEVFLQFAPLSFDASTFEIWGCLLNGGRLVVMPPALPSLEELAAALHASGVTTLWLTAGLFHQMLDSQAAALRKVPQMIAGGDVLSAAHVERFFREPGDGRLVNGYGPTEGTTFSCCFSMTSAGDLRGSVPIGRPIANTRVYILDECMRPLPVGVAGELYIGGDGVARGYLNCPELTAGKFVPDPFAAEGGARLYKSGDAARYRVDGTIEFLGRLDGQVKVRGFRVEPGEVETTLCQYPGVREALVVAPPDRTGNRALAAYLVVDGQRPSVSALRQHVSRSLPEYMVPSTFAFLDALPLTTNGKIDRAALPATPEDRPTLDVMYADPMAGVEERIAAVWRDLLRVRSVGRDDNFFDLGGHSLMVIQVQQQLHATCGWDLSVVDLFRHPTIRALAVHVAPQRAGVRAGNPALGGRDPEVPFPQARADRIRGRLDAMRHQRASTRSREALEPTGVRA